MYTLQTTAKEEKLRMIIHEIRSPLTSISLASENLKSLNKAEGPTQATIVQMTSIIKRNVEQIESLVRSLLHVDEHENIKLSELRVCDLIDNCLKKIEDRIYLNKIEIIKDYEQDLVVLGSTEKLCLAFLNILINSIEACDKDRNVICVNAYRLGDKVNVVFNDNGMGIEPSFASKIFLRKTTTKAHGLGVGLAHVKEILDWHNATIAVNSIPGIGTSTSVILACPEIDN